MYTYVWIHLQLFDIKIPDRKGWFKVSCILQCSLNIKIPEKNQAEKGDLKGIYIYLDAVIKHNIYLIEPKEKGYLSVATYMLPLVICPGITRGNWSHFNFSHLMIRNSPIASLWLNEAPVPLFVVVPRVHCTHILTSGRLFNIHVHCFGGTAPHFYALGEFHDGGYQVFSSTRG